MCIARRLQQIGGLHVSSDVPLAPYTRFGIGGPATLVCESSDTHAFETALRAVRESGTCHVVIAGGTNLIVSDAGFDGVVLRFTGTRISNDGARLRVEAGLPLQSVVDHSIAIGLRGMETMTGIPGSLGAAVYGNAGAYGRSINECVQSVVFTDGDRKRVFENAQCEFDYRESIFKRNKDWIILSAELSFEPGDSKELRQRAGEIRAVRDAKYPPSMKCAGSIFKNCFFARLPSAVQAMIPPNIVREGKVPSAWFLEQVGAKGMRAGDIQVATYHANLIYNDGNGTAADLAKIITDLRQRVKDRFGFDIEEEVQYVGSIDSIIRY
ncbi:MAG: UDP-N-acetylmuramate dehydrogenase [Bryobacteraceae bacterium]